MASGMNILDDKLTQFRSWLDSIVRKRGIDSTLTIGQIYEMLSFLDGMEEKMDEIILKALGTGESNEQA